MRILVYGGGAVGLGIASCLLKSRCRVDIIARENTVLRLREHDLAHISHRRERCSPPA